MRPAQLERLIAQQGSASLCERPLTVLYGELRASPARAAPQQVDHHETDPARARDLPELSRGGRSGRFPTARASSRTPRAPCGASSPRTCAAARIRLERFPRNHNPAAPVGGARKN
jgi:hypothetical protein